MTHNQIDFWKLNEERRSNYANEQIRIAQNAEAKRANLANENLTRARNEEVARANRAQEELSKLDQQLRQSIAQMQNATTRLGQQLSYDASRYSTEQSRLASDFATMSRAQMALNEQEIARDRLQNEKRKTDYDVSLITSKQKQIAVETDLAPFKMAVGTATSLLPLIMSVV